MFYCIHWSSDSDSHHIQVTDCSEKVSNLGVFLALGIWLALTTPIISWGWSGVSTDGPQTDDGATWDFSTFRWCKKRPAFSRNHASNFESWSFPGLVVCVHTLLWCWAVAAGPSQPRDREGKQLIQPSGPTQPFCFSLSVQDSISYMRQSTLYYKRLFVRWYCPTVG